MPVDNLLLERESAVALITINRPQALNAMTRPMLDDLRRTVLDLQRDDAIRVIVIRGAGERAFMAGADIGELAEQTPTSGREHSLSQIDRGSARSRRIEPFDLGD